MALTDLEMKDMNAAATDLALTIIDAVQAAQEKSNLPDARKLLLILVALKFVHIQLCKAAELPPGMTAIADTLAVEWASRAPLPSVTGLTPNTGKANA